MKILKVIWKERSSKVCIIKDVLYERYIKCCQAGIYLDGAMLQEEALNIRTELNHSNLGDFKASNEWLEHFKNTSVGLDAPTSRNYLRLFCWWHLEHGWIRVLFKSSSRYWISKNQKKLKGFKGGKKSKEGYTVAFFASSSGFNVCKPVVIRKSKVPRCFQKLHYSSKPYGMQ